MKALRSLFAAAGRLVSPLPSRSERANDGQDAMTPNDEPGLIRFGPCICGQPTHLPESGRPPWAELCGFDECVRVLDEDGLARLSPPAVGETVLLDVEYPFEGRIGTPFWCIYQPPLAALNGLADAPPAEIAETRMVRCSLTAFDRQPDRSVRGHAGGVVRCRAAVDRVVNLEDLLALPVEAEQGDEVGRFYCVQAARCDDWRFFQSDIESDVIEWVIWREVDGVGHLLMIGCYDFHTDFIYGGHRLLTPAEHARMSADHG